MGMTEKTECCYVMAVIKGEAMFSLHFNCSLFTMQMCIYWHTAGYIN